MIPSISLLLSVTLASLTAAQSSSIVCVAGQCLEGISNTTLGATLNIPSNPSILLLPGQYTTSSQPQLLHDALSSRQASLSLSSGFSNSSVSSSSSTPSLPLTIALQPGVLSHPQSLYRGQATFTQFASSTNRTPVTLSPGSFLVAPNTWAALTSSSVRMVVWDAIPDFAQLPSTGGGALSLTDIQLDQCSPPCASSGTCTPSGQCSCAPGFTGTSCEICASNFFGSSCQPCPSNCAQCDQGLAGTGKCLVPTVTNPPSSCNCLNGVCGSNGQCTCNAGWTTSNNGTACASCAPGFFLTPDGDCSICQSGCTQCSDGTGDCKSCKSGFTLDRNDPTRCVSTSTSTAQNVAGSNQPCGPGSFANGNSCDQCSSTCRTCSGPTPNDCNDCAAGLFALNGQCVPVDGNGVCSGTNMIARNDKGECDSCPAKCTACKIPIFNVTSTILEVQCTGCLPGFVLSQGKCVATCPNGTFLGSDNLTCSPCDSSCSSCVGDSKFCLACNANQLAVNGTCTTTCPQNTFSSAGSCLTCHPDCATCSGSAFNQCSTCPSPRPVLSSGRCLPTCSRSEFLDATSSSCKPCDGSCASCMGPGPNACLACSNPNQVLRSGSCAASSCTSSSNVVPGLGVCLSDLVAVANPTSSPPALPTLTLPPTSSSRRPLAWWEVLLMALGCAFIFVIILWLWRRRARKHRAKQTALFASKMEQRGIWRRRLGIFAGLFKGNHRAKYARGGSYVKETEYQRLRRLRDAEAARHEHEMSKIESAYAKSARHSPSPQPSIDGESNHMRSTNRASAPSLYSQLTGQPRKIPEPKQPTKDIDLERGDEHLLSSRFSTTTGGSSLYRQPSGGQPEALPPMPTEAETYAASHRPAPTSFWLIPTDAGSSKNPFRR